MTLGQRLTALRKEKQWTQEELAELLQVSRQAVSRWERDAALPETNKLLALKALYGCSLDALFGFTQPAHPPLEDTAAFPGFSCLGGGLSTQEGRMTMLYTALDPALYGIYHGENASMALTAEYCQVFLRLAPEEIHCVLHLPQQGAAAVALGYGKDWNAHTDWCYQDPATGKYYADTATEAEATKRRELLSSHKGDTVRPAPGGIVYRTADGTDFPMKLDEAIDMAYFHERVAPDAYKDVSDRMRAWNRGCFVQIDAGSARAFLSTDSNNFCFDMPLEGQLYCRAGKNGYCERGWAMLSTTCLRPGECRMLANNLDALLPYQPNEADFVEGTCAFPPDGGWYWSIKSATDDKIQLNGCGGDTYEIYRPQW